MWTGGVSLMRPRTPPGDQVFTVVWTSVFGAGFAAYAVEGLGDSDALIRGFAVVRAFATVALLALLVRELVWQSRRPVDRWTGSDTASTAVLGGLAVLLAAAVTFAAPSEPERITGAVVAVLSAALATGFALTRRRELRSRG